MCSWRSSRRRAYPADGRGLMSGLSFNLATETAIGSKRDLLADYTRRLVRAQLWGLANIDAYARIWAEETKLHRACRWRL